MTDCIFCSILAGKMPAHVVYQDKLCTAIMDIRPVNPGHILVIPNYHAEKLAEVDESTAAHMFLIGQKMDQALRKSGLTCEAVNLFMADGEAAGQTVFHTHLHVIPRFKGDGFGLKFGPQYGQMPEQSALARTAQAIQRVFSPRVRVFTPPPAKEFEGSVRRQIRRRISAEEFSRIRRLWIAHSIAEDQRNIPGLLDTLTPDCEYVVVNLGHHWNGHEGAERFYTELLTAFPDIHFDLQNIVIGPQGVWEEARATATHKNPWYEFPATGEQVDFSVNIFFPWDETAQKFRGERVYMFYPSLH